MPRRIAELKRPDGTVIRIFREELLWKLLESKELPSTPSTDVIQRISRVEHEVKKLKSLDEEVEKLIKLLETYDKKTGELTKTVRELREKVDRLAKHYEERITRCEQLINRLASVVDKLVMEGVKETKPKRKERKAKEREEIPEPPTDKQIDYAKDLFFKIVKEKGGSLNDWAKKAGEELGLSIEKFADIYTLDRKEMSKLIDWLKKQAGE